MKKFAPIAVIVLLALYLWSGPDTGKSVGVFSANSDSALTEAHENRRSNVQVRGDGEVTRILSDDNDGSRHQRFVLRLDSGHTILVAHNIDLAPRVASIRVGDLVEFYGVYEWNERGGVVHWTHHDPQGEHIGGWLKHQGNTYQ